jgi:hypothetical protein
MWRQFLAVFLAIGLSGEGSRVMAAFCPFWRDAKDRPAKDVANRETLRI